MRTSALLCISLCFAYQGPAPVPASDGEGEDGQVRDPSALTLDELIARLPDTYFEYQHDAEGNIELNPYAVEFERRLQGGAELEDDQWVRALEAAGVLRSRSLWPAEVPFTVGVGLPSWLHDTSISIFPMDRQWARVELGALDHQGCGHTSIPLLMAASARVLGPIEEGEHELAFRVVLSDGKNWSGMLTRRVAVVARAEEALRSDDAPAIGEALRSALRVEFHWFGQQRPFMDVSWNFEPMPAEIPEDLAFGLAVEVLQHGEVREEASGLVSIDDPLRPFSLILEGSRILAGGAYIPMTRPADLDGWTIRVRGDARASLTEWHTNSYWSGAFEMPLAEALQRSNQHR